MSTTTMMTTLSKQLRSIGQGQIRYQVLQIPTSTLKSPPTSSSPTVVTAPPTIPSSSSSYTYGRITISHPASKNAFSGKMMVELNDIISELESSRAPQPTVVTIIGEGDFFCSGADLSLVGELNGSQMCFYMQNVLTRLSMLSNITIGCIYGGSIGGGTELCTSFDHRVMSSKAIFRSIHPKMGLTPGWGGAERLYTLLGRSKAIRVLCGAEKLQAKDCLNLGLCDYIASEEEDKIQSSEDLELFALRKYQNYLDMPPNAIKACKLALLSKEYVLQEQKLLIQEREREIFSKVWGGSENVEALSKAKVASHHSHTSKA
jgi:enoyl-CoA hydratase/carnithine racemase